MQVYDMIVDERRRMAGLLADLTGAQLRQQSLCAAWTVHEVAAHLTTFLRFGQAKLYLGILATAGNVDKVNLWVTRRAARRPIEEIVELLSRRAYARTTIPRSGYDPVLTDIMLHDMDIRRPLGISRITPEDRLWVAFHHLTKKPAPGYGMGTMGWRLQDLRLVATDTGWTHGAGRLVEGSAEALLLGISGRPAGLAELDGDGVPLLHERVISAPPVGPRKRMATVLGVLVHPPPPERRSRKAVGHPRAG